MTRISMNDMSGFDLADLTQENTRVALTVNGPLICETEEKLRLLIISSNQFTNYVDVLRQQKENGSEKRIKRTHNRKQITFESVFTHNGVSYQINNGGDMRKLGLYVELLHSIAEQLQIALSKWRRVFVLRSELHMPYKTDNSEQVTKFIKRLSQKLKREYGFKEIGYCWAREYHGKGKGQHYHFALLLDGNLIRHSSRINEIIRKAWQYPTDDYTVGKIERPYYFVDDEIIAQKAMYRLSYLAKTRGKGYRPPQSKDFQCSRMRRSK